MEQYADVVLDLAGNAVEGATVQVLAGSGNAQSGYTTAAQIFDVNGATQPNPVMTGKLGEFAFSAVNGKYVLRVMVRGTVYRTLGPLTFYDPVDDTERGGESAGPDITGADGATKVGYGITNVGARLDTIGTSLDALGTDVDLIGGTPLITVARDDLIPELHLKRFLSKTNPVVVMVGDSIGTDTADTIGRTESLWSLLREKLTHAYPNKTITFVNRAIGGETYFTAVGLPVGFPAWYTDHARAWPLYVGDLSPDLVVFNFGMNDENAFQSSTLYNYENLLSNAGVFPAGKPDVIYCSNLTPSLVSTIANTNTKAAQDGRHFVAGYTRSWARSKGYGLLDFHRAGSIVKDGFDPTVTSLKRIGSVAPVSGAVTAPVACTDFKWVLSVSTLTAAQPLAVKLAAEEVTDSAGRGAFAVLSVNGSGKIVVDLYDRPGNIYAGLVGAVTAPAGAFTLTVEKKQQTLIILVNEQEVVSYNQLRVHGKDFAPRAGDATYQGGNITAATFFAGEYKRCLPALTNTELWGESTTDVSMKLPYGGNGVNHLSSRGVAAIFKPVLDGSGVGSVLPTVTVQSADVAFANGWGQLAGFDRSRFVKLGPNTASVSLHITPPSDGATGVISTTVPTQYRPPVGTSVFIQMLTANLAPARAQLDPDGTLRVVNGGNGYLFGSCTYST